MSWDWSKGKPSALRGEAARAGPDGYRNIGIAICAFRCSPGADGNYLAGLFFRETQSRPAAEPLGPNPMHNLRGRRVIPK
jgi:hypothetical protein